MIYKSTKRKGALLALLDLITCGLFFFFFMIRIRREIGTFSKKKGMPYPVAFLLGFVTLFFSVFVWFANRAEALQEKAEELKLQGKITSFEHNLLWTVFGAFIIVGPFIATHRFFSTLNRIEAALNEQAEAKPEVGDTPAEEVSPEEAQPEATPDEKALPSEEKAIEEAPAEDSRLPQVKFDPNYAGISAKTWSVRVDGKVHYFYRQSEAIAFAQRIAKEKGVNVTVKGKKN